MHHLTRILAAELAEKQVTVNAFAPVLQMAYPADQGRLLAILLRIVARHRVGNRPDRYEPRERKRRAKAYPLMHRPRRQSKKLLAKAG